MVLHNDHYYLSAKPPQELKDPAADGLSLYFASWRGGSPSGDWTGYDDLYVTTRATRNDPWGPAVNLGPTVNRSGVQERSPWISADGLELYFMSWRSGGNGASDIWVARRPTEDGPWGQPVNLGSVVNSAYRESYLSLSADGLLLFFSEGYSVGLNRPDGYGGADMWMTRRASFSAPWQTPVNLGPKMNSPSDEVLPRITPDGRTLYFYSSRSGVENYQASILPTIDFNGDGNVNMKDFSRLAQYWRQNEPSVDIGPMAWGNGRVDIQDVVVFAEHWLEGPRPISHWRLDETEGWVAHDSAGAHDGIVSTLTLWRPTGGRMAGAIELDGMDDYVGTPFVLDPAVGPFTVSAWVKGGAAGQVVLSQKGGADWLCADPLEGKLMTRLKAADQGQALISQSVITDGQWHKVGLVWDGSTRTLFVDNIEVAKDTQASLTGSQGGLQIGAGKGLDAGSFWSGLIDDVQIYDRAVTP